jgi:general secretion pathway protein F
MRSTRATGRKVLARMPSDEERATVYFQLAQLEDAGMPAANALQLVADEAPRTVAAAARCAAAALGAGRGLAAAGYRCGLFTALERDLLAAVLEAGSPAPAYRRLAERYRARAARRKAMRARLVLPCALWALALFLAPLPALVTGSLDAVGYCLSTVGVLAVLALLFHLLFRGPAWLRRGLQRWPGWALKVDRLNLGMPLFGPMALRRGVRDFLAALALMAEAGIPLLDAVPAALGAVDNLALRRSLSTLGDRLLGGSSFADALRGNPYLNRGHARALLSAGEGSGKLPEMLRHWVRTESEAIESFDALVAEWAPRLAYLAVLGWIAYGILQTGAGGSA